MAWEEVSEMPAPALAAWETAGGAAGPSSLLAAAGLEAPPPSGPAGVAIRSPRTLDWLAALADALTPALTLPLVEHLFGAVPLLAAAFPAGRRHSLLEAARGNEVLVALGLFTPSPGFSPGAAAVAAVPLPGADGRGGRALNGRVRLNCRRGEAALIALRSPDGEEGLGLLPLPSEGTEGKGIRVDLPWIQLEGAVLAEDLLSAPLPLSLEAGAVPSPFARAWSGLAAAAAFVAARHARQGIKALRRAARESAGPGAPMSSSQLVAMGLTELEIEADLAAAAARHHLRGEDPLPGQGGWVGEPAFALATAAAGLLARVAERTAELALQAGLAPEGPLGDPADRAAAQLFCGGPRPAESALASSLGL